MLPAPITRIHIIIIVITTLTLTLTAIATTTNKLTLQPVFFSIRIYISFYLSYRCSCETSVVFIQKIVLYYCNLS